MAPLAIRVATAVEQAMADSRTPGASIGISRRGNVEYLTYGVASIENPLPVTPDTIFQVGSVTKVFTATAAMRLVESGVLELDLPIRRYLPELRLADAPTAAAVTMRHLLTHTGGWLGDYFADHGRGDDALAGIVSELDRLPQLTPAGEVWAYNNAVLDLSGYGTRWCGAEIRLVQRVARRLASS